VITERKAFPATISRSDAILRSMTTSPSKPTCFIAMPITVHDDEAEKYGDPQHWAHVMEHLFVPAIEKAGYTPIRPSASGTGMIHARIVQQLVEADLVLCDLSKHNPNVLFELGVRTSLDRPVALVKDEYLNLPFDIQGLNTHHYSSKMRAWDLVDQIQRLSIHIADTKTGPEETNPLWKHFGVSIAASAPASTATPQDATLQLILEGVERLRSYTSTPFTPVAEAAFTDDNLQNHVLHALDSVAVGSYSLSIKPTADRQLLLRFDTPSTESPEQNTKTNTLVTHLQSFGFPVRVEHTDSTSIWLLVAPPAVG
jgi:hypothetical protein